MMIFADQNIQEGRGDKIAKVGLNSIFLWFSWASISLLAIYHVFPIGLSPISQVFSTSMWGGLEDEGALTSNIYLVWTISIPTSLIIALFIISMIRGKRQALLVASYGLVFASVPLFITMFIFPYIMWLVVFGCIISNLYNSEPRLEELPRLVRYLPFIMLLASLPIALIAI